MIIVKLMDLALINLVIELADLVLEQAILVLDLATWSNLDLVNLVTNLTKPALTLTKSGQGLDTKFMKVQNCI